MINSRSLNDLHQKVQAMAQEFLDQCKAVDIDVIITSTYRDSEDQAVIYAMGRTTPGPIRTNARPGQSFHNYQLAFDFCPIVHGKAMWDDLALFARCGAIGKQIGLDWAGDWTTFKEYAHLQYTGGLTLADLQAGKTIPEVA